MSTTTKETIVGIFITPDEGGKITEVPEVEAVAGLGLKGDRYYTVQLSRTEDKRRPRKELTLVEQDAVDLLNNSGEYGTVLPGDLRRNLVTNGLDLNSLVGKTFSVGEVKAIGLELCDPCHHLEKLTGKKIMKPLVQKGGLRAQILASGIIRKGDQIMVSES